MMEQDSDGARTGVTHPLADAPLATAQNYALLTSPTERKRALVILFCSLMCVGAGQSVLFAILPPISRKLGISEIQVTTIFAVSAAIWVFSSPFWGARSDHVGRKPIMLMGLIAFAVSFGSFASVMLAGLNHLLPVFLIFPLMIATRSIYGLLGSGTFVSAEAYVADRTTRAERTRWVATIAAAFGLGTTVGPGIGSALVVFGLFAPFYFISAAAVISAAAIWYFLPERSRPRSKHPIEKRLKWHDKRMRPFLIFGFFLSVAGTVPIQTVAFFFMDVLHLKESAAAQYVGISLMASSMAALFAQLGLVQQFNPSARTLMRWGTVIAVFSNVIFLISHSYGPLVFAMALSGLGFGMARPGYAAAASLSVSPDEQGAVAGVIGATSATGFIVGPIIGALYEMSPLAPYALAGAIMAGLFVYARFAPALRYAGLVTADAGDEIPETQVPNA
ncbi:MAG TPA: MFS transporter [Rhizomicrobium sp.]|nr:MFS transporter [Rhizomicrobium sp.]